MRQMFERILAALALALLSPLLLFIALAVAASPGTSILFRQQRAGKDGVPFNLVKFRSMSDARDEYGNLLPDAARLTRIGSLLRRTRLDELPELWNIICGEMAFIGPRPLLPETVAAMGQGGERRGRVRPGLTGWAQVNGNSLLSSVEKLSLDLWYVEHRGLGLDAIIVLRTFCVMLVGERINQSSLEKSCAGNSHRRG